MTKEQFIILLQSPATINLKMVKGLEEITERFPYFQNAHLLLAKQYQGHQNIRYESYLKKAAAYASDRKVLYDLINLEAGKVIHMEKSDDFPEEHLVNDPSGVNSNKNQEEGIKTNNSNPEPALIEKIDLPESVKISEDLPDASNHTDELPAEEIIAEWPEVTVEAEKVSGVADATILITESHPAKDLNSANPKPEVEINTEPENELITPEISSRQEIKVNKELQNPVNTSSENSIPIDPKEILAKRLRELESKASEEILSKNEEQVSEPEITDAKEVNVIEAQDPLPEKEIPAFVRVRTEERELRQPRDPSLRIEEHHTFLDWLKIKDIPVIPAENISEYFKQPDSTVPASGSAGDKLIDQFIKSDPRIVAARSEFYSPGNMARQSAIDHEELISETLARIYAQQGNIPKAIEAYNRLSLKMPEKSSYFAALIKDLENQKPL